LGGQEVTKVVKFEAQAAFERQAREWLVRMDGDEPLTEAETEVPREWMRRSVLHREEIKRICKFWGQANVLTELAVRLESATEKRSNRSAR
jgi:ferric-dicitrate binding protein FerR (iron transport regulator)